MKELVSQLLCLPLPSQMNNLVLRIEKKRMKAPNTDRFYAEVYDVVRQIPSGHVLSYGRIAELIGWPNHSRLVGRAMHDAPLALGLPCHRVVNSAGRTVPGWHQQAMLLMSEGVRIKANGCVDMRAHEWQAVR